ncbi:MAG: hypothetical protein K5872_19045 [Rhizobiaceae bacterium]|nr:hypothetical protein [Rhizobiaceae bacterium]MCV0408325.1 hypothetical protein [Rhizobiaceae bacterium]
MTRGRVSCRLAAASWIAAAALVVGAAQAGAEKAPPKVTSLDETEISAGDLHDAYSHWKGEVLTVAGYPSLYFSPSPWSARLGIGAAPEVETPELVSCDFGQEPSDEMIESTTPLVVRGTFVARSISMNPNEVPKINLKYCELVSAGEPFPTDGDPWTIGETPVTAEALHAAVFGWQGKPVRVTGYYHGSTYSSAPNVTRHDLKPSVSGSVVVGCNQDGEVSAPDDVLVNREGVVVEGTIGTPMFSSIIIEECRFVER